MSALHCEGFVAGKVASSSESVKLICLFNVAIANVTKVEWVKTGEGPVAVMYVEDGRIQNVTFWYAFITSSLLGVNVAGEWSKVVNVRDGHVYILGLLV